MELPAIFICILMEAFTLVLVTHHSYHNSNLCHTCLYTSTMVQHSMAWHSTSLGTVHTNHRTAPGMPAPHSIVFQVLVIYLQHQQKFTVNTSGWRHNRLNMNVIPLFSVSFYHQVDIQHGEQHYMREKQVIPTHTWQFLLTTCASIIYYGTWGWGRCF